MKNSLLAILMFVGLTAQAQYSPFSVDGGYTKSVGYLALYRPALWWYATQIESDSIHVPLYEYQDGEILSETADSLTFALVAWNEYHKPVTSNLETQGMHRDSMSVFTMSKTDTAWFWVGPERGYAVGNAPMVFGSETMMTTLRYNDGKDGYVKGWRLDYVRSNLANEDCGWGGIMLYETKRWESWNDNPNLIHYQFTVGYE